VNQEESEQNEVELDGMKKEVDSKGKVMRSKNKKPSCSYDGRPYCPATHFGVT